MGGKLARSLSWGFAAAAFLLLYAPVLYRLAGDWATDDNYSHGFVILPFAAYFAWAGRGELAGRRPQPSALGLGVVLAGLATFLAGQLGAELFLTRVSMLMVIAGVVVFVAGWGSLRALAFPLAFLLLMIPIPAIIFNKVAFPLQLLASRAGEAALGALDIPVLREGNLIVLAHTTLEVAEACSGIRSLVSLITLGIIYGYFVDSRTSVRSVIALATVPIAVFANGVRVAGTGIAAHHFGHDVAQGFFHAFSGWLMFGVAFGLLLSVTSLVLKLTPPAGTSNARPHEVTA